jgi:hypothetical protein
MSGSGGGDGDRWRPTAPPEKPSGRKPKDGGKPNPCDIVEKTNLNSPNRQVLTGLKVGDVLDVEFRPPALVAVTVPKKLVAGSITSPSMNRILGCIKQGEHYEAEVLSISGAICQVEVRLK